MVELDLPIQHHDDQNHQQHAKHGEGDFHPTQRNLQVESIYQGRTFKHILVPVWLTTYTYGPKSFQVVVNGYTGKMAGEFPLSWVKITCAVLGVLLVIFIIVMLNQQ